MPRGRKPATSSKVKLDIHGNEKSNSKVNAVQVKAKKLIVSTKDEKIKALTNKKGRPKTKLKHVLPITEWLYITCDSRTWKLVEVIDKVDSKTGKKLPDKPVIYWPHLDGLLKSCIHHELLVPDDIKKLNENFNHLYKLIDERIPPNVKPRDLFELKEVDDGE